MTRLAGPTRLGGARSLAAEHGAGLIGTTLGVTMFLLFLLLAVQVSSHLYATSVVTASAFDAASRVSAADPTDPACVPPTDATILDAQRHLEQLLGGLGEGAVTDWSGTNGDEVVLRVAVPTPARLIGGTGIVTGLDSIERTVRLQRECFR